MKPLLLSSFFILFTVMALSVESQKAAVAEADDDDTDIAAPASNPCLKNKKLPQCK